jgi:Protein of unknown function (DUF4238)
MVLNLLALIYQRQPRKRAHIDKFMERVWKDVGHIMVQTPERWASVVKSATAAGMPEPTATYEQMKEFIEGGEYDIKTSREYHIGLEFEVFDDLLPIFFDRKWTLCRAPESTGGFVTSDNPVLLGWSRKESGTPRFPPGLASLSILEISRQAVSSLGNEFP